MRTGGCRSLAPRACFVRFLPSLPLKPEKLNQAWDIKSLRKWPPRRPAFSTEENSTQPREEIVPRTQGGNPRLALQQGTTRVWFFKGIFQPGLVFFPSSRFSLCRSRPPSPRPGGIPPRPSLSSPPSPSPSPSHRICLSSVPSRTRSSHSSRHVPFPSHHA